MPNTSLVIPCLLGFLAVLWWKMCSLAFRVPFRVSAWTESSEMLRDAGRFYAKWLFNAFMTISKDRWMLKDFFLKII